MFALNGLMAALILWLAAAEGPLRGMKRAAALGLVAGLGLSNHVTCVLLAPVGIVGAIRAMRETSMPRVATAGIALGALVVGLTPYLYLMVTRDTLISWARIDDFEHLVRHFLRSDYGGPAAFSAHGKEVSTGTSMFAMVQTIGRAWLWLPAVLGASVIAWRIARPRGPESRWGWAMLALSFVVAGPVLASRFNVMPEGIGLYVVRRFHILPALMLAPAVAVGFDEIGAWAQRRLQHGSLRSVALGGSIATVAFFAVAGLSLPHLLQVHSPAVELGLRNTLRSLPPNAVVITHTDLSHFGMGYLQGALGERPDVTIISWPSIPSPTYRQRLERRIGIVTAATGASTVEVADQVIAKGLPLFIDPFNSNIAKAFPTYPYGILFRVLPRGTAVPSIDEVFALNKAMFERFDLSYAVPGFDDEHATELHHHYARLWHILAQGLEAAGRREEQGIANAFAEALAPHD